MFIVFKTSSPKDEISGPENLTLLILDTQVNIGVTTHTPLCNTLSSNKRPKTVKILVGSKVGLRVKLSKNKEILAFFHNFNIFIYW